MQGYSPPIVGLEPKINSFSNANKGNSFPTYTCSCGCNFPPLKLNSAIYCIAVHWTRFERSWLHILIFIPSEVYSHNIHKSYTRRFFLRLALQIFSFLFKNILSISQPEKKPTNLSSKNIFEKEKSTMSLFYPTDSYFIALLIYANYLIAQNYWLTRLESWLPDYPREK